MYDDEFRVVFDDEPGPNAAAMSAIRRRLDRLEYRMEQLMAVNDDLLALENIVTETVAEIATMKGNLDDLSSKLAADEAAKASLASEQAALAASHDRLAAMGGQLTAALASVQTSLTP